GDASSCGTTTVCTLVVAKATNAIATFDKIAVYSLSITVDSDGGGSIRSVDGFIDCGTTCSHGYTTGTTVTLMAEHDPDVAFIGWLGDAASCGESASCSVTMSSARSVTAKFGAAGTAVWVTKAGGPGFDTTDHVTVDKSDYVITAGRFESATLIDGTSMLARS